MVDGASRAGDVDVPVGPAVAGRRALHRGTHLVDRAAMITQRIRGRERTVGTHACMPLAGRVRQDRAGPQQARLDQHWKDVGLILELGRNANAALPLSELHSQLLERASTLGFGQLDNSAIIKAFEVAVPTAVSD